MNKKERIQKLIQYYASELAEDPLDGTTFDCDVFNALEAIQEKYTTPPAKKCKCNAYQLENYGCKCGADNPF